jgi:hypothetical protein
LGVNEDEDEDVDDTEDTSSEENDKEEDGDKGVEILSVEAEFGSSDEDGDGVEIKDVEVTSGDEDSNDEESDDEESDEDESKDESDDEQNEEEGADEAKKSSDKNDNMLCDAKEPKSEKEQKAFLDSIDDKIEDINRKVAKKKQDESMMVSKYPMSALLGEGMFAEFMAMNDAQKSNVMSYITERNLNPASISNAVWESAKSYAPSEENWLKYAPANYKTLYESADETTRESIRNTAQYFIFENQYDINSFWRNTGLKERSERSILNEKFVNNMPHIERVNENDGLGYSMDYVNMIAEMASAYNN